MIGVVLTVLCYTIARLLNKKFQSALLNPVLVAMLMIMFLILLTPLEYENYQKGASYIGKSLGPVVVLLAIPLYKHRFSIKRYFIPIILGVFINILSSVLMIVGLSYIFELEEVMMMTLIPKSITTPMAMEVSQMLQGMPDITVVVVIVTGILGAVVAPFIMRLGIRKNIAKGIAIGASSHGIGTAKAMEMDDEVGAMSSLAMGLAGIVFVLLTSFYGLVFM